MTYYSMNRPKSYDIFRKDSKLFIKLICSTLIINISLMLPPYLLLPKEDLSLYRPKCPYAAVPR